MEKLDEIMDISSVYQNFINYFTENGYRRPWGEIDVSALSEVLKQKTGVTVKIKNYKIFFWEESRKNPELKSFLLARTVSYDFWQEGSVN